MSCAEQEETVNLQKRVQHLIQIIFFFLSPEFKVVQVQPRHSVGVALKRQLQTNCPFIREAGMRSSPKLHIEVFIEFEEDSLLLHILVQIPAFIRNWLKITRNF